MITQEYVEEACRFINQTILKLERSDVFLDNTAIHGEANIKSIEKDIRQMELRNK